MDLSVLKKMTILLAEDDAVAALFLANILQNYFGHVLIVHDGEEALNVIQKTKIDLLITDITMPCLSGIKLIDTIRKSEKNTLEKLPIIVVSGRQDTQELLEIVRLGLIDYLVKPISFARINEAIQRFYTEINIIYHIDETMTYNPLLKSLCENSKVIPLTPLETTLMETLLKNRKQLLPKSILMEKIYNHEVSDATFRNLLTRFCKKLGKHRLSTVTNMGIKLL